METHLQLLLGVACAAEVSQQKCMIQAEGREEEILVGIRLLHGIEEVWGENCETLKKSGKIIKIVLKCFLWRCYAAWLPA